MIEKVKIKIKKMENARDIKLPDYMTEKASGLDLHANVEKPVVIKPGKYKLIPTGISLSMPEGYEAQIRPRSGLALKHGITLLNSPGTIDADYRGEIKVIMLNLGEKDYTVNRGDRIAQMVINKVVRADFELVKDLDATDRGESGFGHTGI
ncbi:MAG: dUTP pyrophosphatase [Thermosediminibacterales bacterium]|nr:dUTP pyrophosphatase [Thermosediminibacterales bacterium]MDK2836358.1 dUTP pyrophosphatase [Thermosediminibacterales bacterium]